MKLLTTIIIIASSLITINYQINKITSNDIIGLWTNEVSKNKFGITYRFFKDATIQINSSQLVNISPGEISMQQGSWELSNDKIICKIIKENIVIVKGGKPIEFGEGIWSDNVEQIKDTNKKIEIYLSKIDKENKLYFTIDDKKYKKISSDPFEP